ncbi:MAG: iron-sulfur cluster biosynthesis family protein [Dehalococcoidales bacterium]|nr:iron-sulfur cluster biosynthesis family protein [Dehalococcoidales bacterium]
MITVTDRAAQELRDKVLQRCVENRIGVRLSVSHGDRGQVALKISIDRQYQDDTVIDLEDVKLFLDPYAAAYTQKNMLDWSDGPARGFRMRTVSE